MRIGFVALELLKKHSCTVTCSSNEVIKSSRLSCFAHFWGCPVIPKSLRLWSRSSFLVTYSNLLDEIKFFPHPNWRTQTKLKENQNIPIFEILKIHCWTRLYVGSLCGYDEKKLLQFSVQRTSSRVKLSLRQHKSSTDLQFYKKSS